MAKVFIVTGTNRTIKADKIFELNILGMFPTMQLAEVRLKALEDIGDFDRFDIREFDVAANGSDLNVSLV